MPVATYRLYVPFPLKIILFGTLGAFTVVGLALLIGLIPFAQQDALPKRFPIFWLGMVGWCCFWPLSIPHKIVVSEGSQIEFISVIRRRRVAATDMRLIRPDTFQSGFLLVRATRGMVRLLNQFDGFHELFGSLKVVNPDVELHGC